MPLHSMRQSLYSFFLHQLQTDRGILRYISFGFRLTWDRNTLAQTLDYSQTSQFQLFSTERAIYLQVICVSLCGFNLLIIFNLNRHNFVLFVAAASNADLQCASQRARRSRHLKTRQAQTIRWQKSLWRACTTHVVHKLFSSDRHSFVLTKRFTRDFLHISTEKSPVKFSANLPLCSIVSKSILSIKSY